MVWPPRSRRGRQSVREPDFPLALFLLSGWYRNSKAGAGSRPGVCVFPRWHRDRRRRKQEQRGTRPPLCSSVQAPTSSRFQNAQCRFCGPRPLPGFPRHPSSFAWRCPSPAAIGRRRGPPTAPPSRQGSVPRAARSCGQLADC